MPPLVEIGLTELQNSGGAKVPPAPPLTTALVRVAFVLIFAVVQLCTAEYVVNGRKMTLDDNLSLNPNQCHHRLINQLSYLSIFCKPILITCV